MSEALPAPGESPDEAPRLVPAAASADRREYSFQSLLQLAGELSLSLGLYETLDLLTLSLMGQFGATRSAVWLMDEEAASPVLVRHRGMTRASTLALGSICADALLERFRSQPRPVLAWAMHEPLGPAAIPILEHAGVALFAPLRSGEQLLGWLALGNRLDGQHYGPAELEVLEASLGIVSSSILNRRLYSRVLEANRQLRGTNERLGELDRLKSDFVANVNHELRTPLTVMIGALDCAAGLGNMSDAQTHFVSGALESARHLWSLVENLLTFSEMTRDEVLIRPETTSLPGPLQAWFQQRQPGVATRLRELTLSCAPDLLPATFDRLRLTQILDELLDNAVKFTPQGSHIRVEADLHEHGSAIWGRIRVMDDGPGIPASGLTSLFKPFQQVDGSSTRTVGGLGMGLAFCRQLAERMSCQLLASSQPGRGTTFTLLVPTAERGIVPR